MACDEGVAERLCEVYVDPAGFEADAGFTQWVDPCLRSDAFDASLPAK